MDREFQCHVQKLSFLMSSWGGGWIVATSSEGTTAVAQKVENLINIYSTFYSTLQVPMHLYCISTMHATCSKFKNIRDFRVQLAKELIGDYFSRRRVGRHVSFLKNLPLRHFPVKLESADTTRRNRHCCTRCVDKYGKRTDTQWFCQECAVALCHTGKPSTECFLQWHKNIDLHQ